MRENSVVVAGGVCEGVRPLMMVAAHGTTASCQIFIINPSVNKCVAGRIC